MLSCSTHSSDCCDTLSLSLCACPELQELPMTPGAALVDHHLRALSGMHVLEPHSRTRVRPDHCRCAYHNNRALEHRRGSLAPAELNIMRARVDAAESERRIIDARPSCPPAPRHPRPHARTKSFHAERTFFIALPPSSFSNVGNLDYENTVQPSSTRSLTLAAAADERRF